MTLPFGESHWDYLPDLIQDYIEDLAARAVHRGQMKAVCKSIQLYGARCYQNQTVMELFLDYYPETSLVIKSQICPQCFKIFSPEIDLSKHLSVCTGLEEESDFYESFSEDEYGDDFIDDVYDDAA